METDTNLGKKLRRHQVFWYELYTNQFVQSDVDKVDKTWWNVRKAVFVHLSGLVVTPKKNKRIIPMVNSKLKMSDGQ